MSAAAGDGRRADAGGQATDYKRDQQVEAEFDGVWRPGKVTRRTDGGLLVVWYDEPFSYEGQTITNGWLPPHRVRPAASSPAPSPETEGGPK